MYRLGTTIAPSGAADIFASSVPSSPMKWILSFLTNKPPQALVAVPKVNDEVDPGDPGTPPGTLGTNEPLKKVVPDTIKLPEIVGDIILPPVT